MSALSFRRPFVINSKEPLVSFTFDDFPASALQTGGAILKHFGIAGTYYTSLGLSGKDAPSGRIFAEGDLAAVVEQGHELGCHTFSHCHSWQTATKTFVESVNENRAALGRLLPGAEFRSLSYPISPPRPLTKARMATHFPCCRGGGQTLNAGRVDLNQLSAYFLEKSRDSIQKVKDIIDLNRRANGWLILATHDICDDPSPYGCTPEFFADVVRYTVHSGAHTLPVFKALEELRKAS
jgi:peptidoglycan/xylan/chitin deacetylase (PgdA/CDA1 family)